MSKQTKKVEDLQRIPDAAERARAAGVLLAQLAADMEDIAKLRVEAVQLMHRSGMSLAQIGAAIGMSRSRAQHLAAEGDVRARALSRKRRLN